LSSQPVLEDLIAAGRGEIPADLVLVGGRVVDVFSGEILEASVAVHQGQVVGLGDYRGHETVDLQGRYLAPGLLDGHMHLESSMVIPTQFARAVVPHGTTTVVVDPHEIANVLGTLGVEFILGANGLTPLEIYAVVPSCVPATEMETSGARLTADDVARLLQRQGVLGLGEMMDFPAVLGRDPATLAKLRASRGRPIDGHCPRLTGRDLCAYIAAGPRSDHESTSADEAREKLRLGMYVMLREGSVTRDVQALLPVVSAFTLRRCLFVTDDREPVDLLGEGHIDFAVRKAVRLGLDPVWALTMASLNTAQYFGLRHLGAVAPGYQADLIVLDNLQDLHVEMVFKAGRLVARQGRALWDDVPMDTSAVTDTVRLAPLDAQALRLGGSGGSAHVIGVLPNQILTRHQRVEVVARNGVVAADPERDLLKLAVVERHHASGRVGLGLVSGFGMKRGALASTVAHDSHNLIIVGASDEDMLHAAEEIRRLQGGLVAVAGGRVLAELPLPVAGLMSDRPLTEVRDAMERLFRAARDLGCTTPSPYMALSFLALPVIPALKLTDQGLVDVERFQKIPLFD
jgi:adenine deaminase